MSTINRNYQLSASDLFRISTRDFLNTRAHIYTIAPNRNLLRGVSGLSADYIELSSNGWSATIPHAHSSNPDDVFEVLVSAIGNRYNIVTPDVYLPTSNAPEEQMMDAYYWGRRGTHLSNLSVSPPQMDFGVNGTVSSLSIQWPNPISGFSADEESSAFYLPVKPIVAHSLGLDDKTYKMLCPSGFMQEATWMVEARTMSGSPVSAMRLSYDSSNRGAFFIDCLTGVIDVDGDFDSDVVHSVETSAMTSIYDGFDEIVLSAAQFDSMVISADAGSTSDLKNLFKWASVVALDVPSAFSTAGMVYDFASQPELSANMDMFVYAPALDADPDNPGLYASTLVVSATPEAHVVVNRITSGGTTMVSAFDIPSANSTTIVTEIGSKRFDAVYSFIEPILEVGVETKLVPAWDYSGLGPESWTTTYPTGSGDIYATTLFAYPTIVGVKTGSSDNVLTAVRSHGARCFIGGVNDGTEYGSGDPKGIVSGTLVPLWTEASAFKKMSVTATLSAESYIDNPTNAKMFDLSQAPLNTDLTVVFPFYVLGSNSFELRPLEPLLTEETSALGGSVYAFRPSFRVERFTEPTVDVNNKTPDYDACEPIGAYSVRAIGKQISLSSTHPVSAQFVDGVSIHALTALGVGERFTFDGGYDIQFISTATSASVIAWSPMSALYADVDPTSTWSTLETMYQYYVPDYITIHTQSLDTMGPTAIWELNAATDADHLDVGLLNSHYVRWYVDAAPASSVSSVSLLSQAGDVVQNGGLGGHDITVNVVPIQVFGETTRISVGLTAVLACKNSATDVDIVDQPGAYTDSVYFYTYPRSYWLELGCDGKKPLSGNAVWSETDIPTINGVFNVYEAGSVRYELGYSSPDTDYTVITSAGEVAGTSGKFEFSPVSAQDDSTVQTYTLNVTANPVGGNFASNWKSTPRRFTTSIVNNVLSAGDLSASPIRVAPTYVYSTSASRWYNNAFDEISMYSESRPSAYALQHTEPFLAWTTTPIVGKNTGWYIERDGVVSEVVHPSNGVEKVEIPIRGRLDENGVPRDLEIVRVISKSERIVGSARPMKDVPFRVYGLSGGEWVLSAYPCYSYTDDSNTHAWDRNIAMVQPPLPSGFSIAVAPEEFVISDRFVLTATMSNDGIPAPLISLAQVNRWALKNGSAWELNTTSISSDPTYLELRSGFYDSVPGYLFYGDSSSLTLDATVHLTYTIVAKHESTTWADDWGTESMVFSVPYANPLSGSSRPRLNFVPRNTTASIGESVVISNQTQTGYYLGGYRISDGVHDPVVLAASADVYTIEDGYDAVGTYSFSVTGYRNNPPDSDFAVAEFPDLVRVYAFEPYDTKVERVYGYGALMLPYGDDEVGIGPNEWVTADNLNRCLHRLNRNLEYVDTMTTFYHNSPTEYSGFIGSYIEGTRTQFGYVDKNRRDVDVQQENSLADVPLVPANIESVVSDPDSDCLYVVSNGKIFVLAKTPDNSILHVIDHSQMNENTTRLTRIAIDSFGDIYTISPDIHKIIVFNKYDRGSTTPCRYITEWGGYGGASAKLKFRKPVDVAVDGFDNVWVADAGNLAVKKYTRSGSWLLTVLLPAHLDDIPGGGIIGLDVDMNGRVHVLTPNFVYVYSSDGSLFHIYSIGDGADMPRFIRKMSNTPYMYIGYATSFKKVNLSGGVVSEFGSDLTYSDFLGCFHDSYRNLYIANHKNLLVYCDGVLISRVSNPSYKVHKWPMEDILIAPDENVQDWVCNVSFQRMYDNIDLLRMSLFGTVEYREVDGVLKLVPVDYHPKEYAQLVFEPKDSVFVGTNELVTMAVINRCVLKLQRCLRILLEHV